jgi:hypothetical protein
MNITSKFFILTCESDSCILQFMKELNLTYRRLTSFVVSFDFIPIVLVSWGNQKSNLPFSPTPNKPQDRFYLES